MWINLLHKIFGSNRNLNRQEIDAYLDDKLSEQERNKIEQKLQSSDFDKNALEGYALMGAKSSDLNRLDKKFNGGFSNAYLLFFSSILFLVAITLVWNFIDKSRAEKQTVIVTVNNKTNNHFIEEEEIFLPQHIDSLIESEKEIISNEDLAKTPKHVSEKNPLPTMQDENESKNIVHTIPSVLQMPELENVLPSVTLHNYAKELYLSELKFIDFRGERLKPIKVKGLATIGTSADLEEKGRHNEHIDWEEKEITYHDYLVKTAVLIKSGSYKKALQRLETILVHYPTDENALFYSGLCYYNLEQYSIALNKWDECMKSFRQNFYEESLWYSLKAHNAMGNFNSVQELAQRIIDEKGFYANQAEKILKK